MSKSDDDLSDIHQQALEQFRWAEAGSRDERRQCQEDRRFACVNGAQWTGPYLLQYENKPRLEVNKVHLAVTKIHNEYRNNRMDVMFAPKDGSEADELCDAVASRYRADEEDSAAEDACDTAFDELVMGGFGAWRLLDEYEDESDPDNDQQRLCWEAIHEADNRVYFDANAKRLDKSDARHAFVLTPYTHDAYTEEFDDDPSSWPKADWSYEGFAWCDVKTVWVAEYYVIEERTDWREDWVNVPLGTEESHLKSKLDLYTTDKRAEMQAIGWKLQGKRKLKRPAVRKYILSGSRVLEDCGYIAGQHIRIIPAYGKRYIVDGVERMIGHVRMCRDAQRLKNIMLSRLADIAGKSAVEKPIFTPEQIIGHELLWSEDNVKDNPYLLVNPIVDPATGQVTPAGPIAYTKPPIIPEALAALLQITEQDIKDLLGNQDQGEQVQPNMSGKLMDLVQQKLDMQAFIYLDNMRKAKKRAGEIWLSAAKEIYVEDGRKLKGVNRAGETTQIVIGKQSVNPQGKRVETNVFSDADFECRVEVGPATASRRQSVVKQMTSLMQFVQDPADQQVILSTALSNMEGEGISDLRAYYRKKLIKMGAAKPTPAEAAELEAELKNQKPDANDEYLQAAAREADANAMQAKANVVQKVSQAELNKAKTVETLSTVDHQQQTQALEIIDRVSPNISQPQATPINGAIEPIDQPPEVPNGP